MPRRLAAIVAGLVLSTATIAGCAGSGSEPSASVAEPLKVFAAASLQSAFDELAEKFIERNPEQPAPTIRYDGSQALATQILDGADVDVIAFASVPSLDPLLVAGVAQDSTVFASNTLQIAVAPGNPSGVEDLDDLADPALKVVLCAEEVPCGAAANALLDAARVDVTPVSEETSVTAVASRIANGEADAGLVYATDVQDSDGALEGMTPANADAAVNRYPIAVANKALSPKSAAAFVEFVLSQEGQAILAEHGFGAP